MREQVMRKISVYLHQHIIDVLICFGDLNKVINRLLKECVDSGLAFVQELPTVGDRHNAKRVNVYIDDETMENLNGIKIRPLIYFFVENELYDKFDWVMLQNYGDEHRKKLNKLIDRAIYSVEKLNNVCKKDLSGLLDILREVYFET
jgi:hypothetical protein